MKKAKRLRRAVKTRAHIRTRDVARLTVHRTPRHIYAQLTDASGAKVIASASTA
jgi:large subunit ribosomal protein L18